MAAHDHYDVLEVSPRAGQDVIDAAYRALMRRLAQAAVDSASVRQRELVEVAYAVLGSPAARRTYDAERLAHAFQRGAALSQPDMRALGHPLLAFLRLQGRDLLVLLAGAFVLMLALDIAYGGIDTWRDVAGSALTATAIAAAAASVQFCTTWRTGIPTMLGVCAGWAAFAIAMMAVARLHLPSMQDVLVTGIGAAVLFVAALWISMHE